MTPTLSVAIMAHPKREAMVADLLTRLDREVPVVWDQINDRHDTGARAMEAFDPACTHHLVIQDDALPCRDLIAGAERALTYVPEDAPVSLYTGRARPFGAEITKAVRRARKRDASWITMRGIYWGPAVILPVAYIPEMLAWFRSPEGCETSNYDRRMSVWWAQRQARVWYSRPSLVDHRGDESLVWKHTNPAKPRHAHEFAGEDTSALTIDFSGPVVDIPYSAAMDHAREAAANRARRRLERAL